MTAVHRVTLMVIDHDGLGPDEVTSVLENVNYPNHCMYPRVSNVETVEVEDVDNSPLNNLIGWRPAFEALWRES